MKEEILSQNFIKRAIEGTKRFAAPMSWSASFVPMAVGYVCAYTIGGASFAPVHALWIIISFLAMAAIETGKHAVNDLEDYRSGNDLAIDEAHKTPVAGGKRVLTEGILNEKETILVALAMFGIAGILGLLIVIFQSLPVLWFGIIGIIISIIYTMPPVRLCYRGWGEIAVGVTYGPLVLLGAYYVFARGNLMIPVLLSVFIGCLITNVLVINEFPDYEADVSAQKWNLVARRGKEKGCRWFLAIFILSYIPIVALVVLSGMLLWLILLILLIPMLKAYNNARRNYDDIGKLLSSNILTINLHKWSGVLCAVCLLLRYFLF